MKWAIIALTITVLLLGGFSLYWFAVRPSIIKHDCSWVKKHSNAIPEREGMTEEELKAKGMLKVCPTPQPSYALSNLDAVGCILGNSDVIRKNKPQKYVPAKDWYEKATTAEYQFCLHDRGL